jgi:ligand-binding sensor domain-containing protein
MRNIRQILFGLVLCSFTVSSQILNEVSFQLAQPNLGLHPQLSNTITDIVITNDTIWLGTGKGLSRSTDGGRTWKNYYNTPEFGTEDISALAVRGKDVWVATAHSVDKDGQSLPEGSGLHYSSDGGTNWKNIAQPIDAKNVDTLYFNSKSFIRALGITTAINNITYDIAISGNAVWICSFAGMARKSTDNGTTWQRVIIPPDNLTSIGPNDSLVFDLSPSGGALGLQNNLNHRAFSVMAESDSIIWIGTAGGINKTTNGGTSWVKFNKQNQISPISGNFVVALGNQKTNTKNVIWAATIAASDNTEKKGVSFSDNGGLTWKQTLLGEFPHNFGFKDDVVYVPTDNGIFRSSDFGNSWTQTGTIYDKINRQHYTQSKFFSAAASGDTAWFGGSDGLVTTIDNSINYFGTNWTISHASQALSSQSETYAYPNPFAPDDEIVRIHYNTGKPNTAKVSLRIFDFGMNLVNTPIQNASRDANRDHDEIWNGKKLDGSFVANGVYFYQLVIDNDEPRWGKILVIQ